MTNQKFKTQTFILTMMVACMAIVYACSRNTDITSDANSSSRKIIIGQNGEEVIVHEAGQLPTPITGAHLSAVTALCDSSTVYDNQGNGHTKVGCRAGRYQENDNNAGTTNEDAVFVPLAVEDAPSEWSSEWNLVEPNDNSGCTTHDVYFEVNCNLSRIYDNVQLDFVVNKNDGSTPIKVASINLDTKETPIEGY